MRSAGRRLPALESVGLALGLAFCAFVLGVSAFDAWAARLLPTRTAEYLELYGGLRRFTGPIGMPLGLATAVAQVADMARFPDLRSRRALLRLVGVGTIIAIALVVAFVLAPFQDAIASGELVRASDIVAARGRITPWWWVQRGLAVSLALCLVAAHRAPKPPLPTAEVADGRYPSRWIPPIFGTTPALPERQWRVLGLMIAAGLFNAYDFQIFSLALKQIQAGLAIDEARLGLLGSTVRLGILPGVLLALAADTLGRRRLLIWTIAGYTVFTAATAFAPDERTFVVCQFLARAFGAAEGTLAGVIVVEEIDAEHRGWAIGVLSALSFLGVALAWLLFSLVDVLPLGWRTLYLAGIGPLLILTALRRRLPESRRFERLAARAGRSLADARRPLASLVKMYPGRFAAVSAVAFVMSFSGQSAGFFFPKFMQDAHGLDPARLTLVGAGVGFAGLCAMPLFGRLGDRRGRKPVAIVFIVLNPLSVIALYTLGGAVVPLLAFLAMSLTDIGSDTNLGVFRNELFPTSYRSTASSAVAIIGQLGGSLGLAVEALLFPGLGSHGAAISLLALAGLAVPFIVAFGYPETSRRALEEISAER